MLAVILFAQVVVTPALAAEVRAAVAANFATAARQIGQLFESNSGHRVVYSFGSTGQLYAQITQGAPFDVFLAADQSRPERTIADHLGITGSRFTYATGRLALYSRDPLLIDGDAALKTGQFTRIAVANPRTAPYGSAAIATLQALGVYSQLADRIVQGNNIAQVYQFVETGNAELGFVALAQVSGHNHGSRWLVPERFHAPIAQDAVLLVHGADNPAAAEFLAFLNGAEATSVKLAFGYGPDPSKPNQP